MSTRGRILARLKERRSQHAPAPERVYRTAPVLGPDFIEQFCQRVVPLGNDLVRVASVSDAPAVVARYLALHAIPLRAVCWPELLALPWREAAVAVEARAARGDDLVGITGVFAAIAETGTLMLVSGAETPATVSLLPETHVAIVPASAVVATMEDAWARRWAQTAMPRAVNFVSGPSRTADVEQTVTLGAHGPRRVLLVVVER
ncbi:MAG: lactate utilization protein C [Sulfurifustis sp.]